MNSLKIEQLPSIIKADVEDFLESCPQSPAARLRPRIGIFGNVWLAFIGPHLQEGATGFGRSPRAALEDFNRNFMEPVISRNGSNGHS